MSVIRTSGSGVFVIYLFTFELRVGFTLRFRGLKVFYLYDSIIQFQEFVSNYIIILGCIASKRHSQQAIFVPDTHIHNTYNHTHLTQHI